jgi:hypothetical protein
VSTRCSAWAYLYTPSREYFWWASVVIPENASATKLSYYEDIGRFTGFIFRYPEIRKEKSPITIVAWKWKYNQAKIMMGTLGKLGINFDDKKSLIEHTWSIATSHINIYWNEEAGVWIKKDSTIVQALKFIEEKIPYSFVVRNEYVTTEWPRIEIVIGDDIRSYFTFAKPIYYLPYLAPTTISWGTNSWAANSIVSWELTPWEKSGNKVSIPTPKNSQEKKENTRTNSTTPQDFVVTPWEWEDF